MRAAIYCRVSGAEQSTINQTIIAVPLVLLLEVSIFLSKFVYKKRAGSPPAED